MSSIEEFCTEVLILNKGKTVLQGNLKEIKQSYPANRVELSTTENVDNCIEELGLKIENCKDNEYEIKIKSEEEGHKLLNRITQEQKKILKFEIKKPSLHDIFIERVGE